MTTADVFGGEKVVLFAVPGAFTPTCHNTHLPGFIQMAGDMKSKGIDTIACTAVNDAFVMNAWGKDQNAAGKVMMVADGNGEFAKKVGLEMDASKFGMGVRSQRYAMVIEDMVVKKLEVEEPGAPGEERPAHHAQAELPAQSASRAAPEPVAEPSTGRRDGGCEPILQPRNHEKQACEDEGC